MFTIPKWVVYYCSNHITLHSFSGSVLASIGRYSIYGYIDGLDGAFGRIFFERDYLLAPRIPWLSHIPSYTCSRYVVLGANRWVKNPPGNLA